MVVVVVATGSLCLIVVVVEDDGIGVFQKIEREIVEETQDRCSSNPWCCIPMLENEIYLFGFLSN